MDTTEARATQDERDPATDLSYDGFISYSHDADDLLAPRLQAGLQRFAKPWWKRRALRIFRDEASLAANPHLWASISQALDDSEWFILLLSPDAAESEWVNREVEYWLEHIDPERIIPVLTEGDFAYANSHIVSDAAPPALRGAFADEPRWVDLRFARTDEQLDLNNASFRAAVADIASAVRGVPKDELESEEVRQHRRTIRTAWAGGIAMLLLTVLATATAVYAIGQRNAATDVARQAIDYTQQIRLAAAAPPGDDYVFVVGGTVPPLFGAAAPATPRLDFLVGYCTDTACFRDAEFTPVSEVLAYEPFHIRHGFVTPDGATADRRTMDHGFDLHVYITRVNGHDQVDGLPFDIGQTYRIRSAYVVTEISDRCGPGYRDQTEPRSCDLFVHEFPDGLPPGRYDFWVEWLAPCRAWAVAIVCDDPDAVITLFASSVNSPFYDETWTEDDDPFGG